MRMRVILSITATVVTVGACAVAVIAVAGSIRPRSVADVSTPSVSASSDMPSALRSLDAAVPLSVLPPAPSDPATSTSTSSPGGPSTSAAPAAVAAAPHGAAPTSTSTQAAPAAPAAPPAVIGSALPLGYSTGSATEVITVVAASTSSTTATLQAWDKAPGGGWLKHGGAIAAHVGSAGLTTHPSESLSATPIGSFGLSRAFGVLANPGTGLSYHQTSSADWWISQSGPLYNTMQTCSSGCGFTLGDPNEHLAAITPEYNYAVVIEYNTSAPIVQGAGSAFFLHVTDGSPTAGCVSIPQANLVSIMQWLNPTDSPRILIGVA